MAINTHILLSSSDIRPYENQLRQGVDFAVEKTKDLLPLGDIDVVLYDNPQGAIPEIGGIGGYSPTKNIVFISLDPRHKDFKNILDAELLYQLAHEFHHAVRFRTPIEKDTLFEAMISEGLADHFAMQVTGREKPQPWSCALSIEQKKLMTEKATKEGDTVPYDHAAWFYGSKSEVIPRWAGYTLGYDIVEKYLQVRKDVSAGSLVDSEARLFLC